MPIYQITAQDLKPISETRFGVEGLMERKDLQRLLRAQIDVIDERLMVISEEFGTVDRIEQLMIYGSWAARYEGEAGPAPNDVDYVRGKLGLVARWRARLMASWQAVHCVAHLFS